MGPHLEDAINDGFDATDSYILGQGSNKNFDFLPLRFRKAGRVWCSGARENH